MTTFYNEWDKNTAAWLRELVKQGHVTEGVVDERSIKDIQPDDVRQYKRCHFFAGIGGCDEALRLAGWDNDSPVWCASCPCQPFSNAGNKRGTDDDRHLWPELYRLVCAVKPPVIFGEQVASGEALAWWDQVASDLEACGYTCWATSLDARCFGYPHMRQRLYWCANTNGIGQPEPWKYLENPGNYSEDATRQADWFVDAVRREALPFVCREHHGVRARVGEVCCHGFGNAVIPEVQASFIRAYMQTPALTRWGGGGR